MIPKWRRAGDSTHISVSHDATYWVITTAGTFGFSKRSLNAYSALPTIMVRIRRRPIRSPQGVERFVSRLLGDDECSIQW
jgi:hypothetical protein